MKMNKKAVLSISIFFISGLLAVMLSNYKGDAWEEIIRKFYYQVATHGSPPVEYTVSVDSTGIPVVIYTAHNAVRAGEKYNPTTIALYAIEYAGHVKEKNDSLSRKEFFNCIQWLEENITRRDGYALYEFNWQQPFYPAVKAPWRSGLTSGKAIEAFTAAYEISGDVHYLNLARLLLRGFFQPIQNGGFTYIDTNGWWYEEYADKGLNTPRVLNGHVYAFLGVRRFWLVTKEDSAAFIVQKGTEAVVNTLANYDVGDGWSYYDGLHKRADKKYHKIGVELMQKLWVITGKPVFLSYYKKWNTPLQRPYLVRIIKERNRSGMALFLLVELTCLLALFVTARVLRIV